MQVHPHLSLHCGTIANQVFLKQKQNKIIPEKFLQNNTSVEIKLLSERNNQN